MLGVGVGVGVDVDVDVRKQEIVAADAGIYGMGQSKNDDQWKWGRRGACN